MAQETPKDYDGLIKELFTRNITRLIRRIDGFESEPIEPLPNELKTTHSTIPDFQHKNRTPDGAEAALHVEFQRRIDHQVTRRMLFYQAHILTNYHLPAWQFVVYIGEENHGIQPRFRHPAGWEFHYRLIELRKLDYRLFFEAEDTETQILTITAHIPEHLRSEVVERLVQKLRKVLKDRERLYTMLVRLQRLANLRKTLSPLVTEKTESSMSELFTPEELETLKREDPLFQSGEKRGERIGEKRGEKKKALETAQQMLQEGFELSTIARISGLSEAEIQNLSRQ